MMHYKWKRFGLHKLIMLILFSVCLASEIVLHKYENITISKHISSDATFGFESKACGRGVLGKWKSFLRTRQPQLLFEEYDKLIVSKLSTFAAACETKYPFIYFGASDGNPDHDRHVRKFYSMSHWQGLFVEASEPKIANWTKNLNWFEASDRSLVVHAAVHNKCPREKIGFVVSGNPVASTTVGHVRLKDNSFGETVNWTVEQVRCLTCSSCCICLCTYIVAFELLHVVSHRQKVIVLYLTL